MDTKDSPSEMRDSIGSTTRPISELIREDKLSNEHQLLVDNYRGAVKKQEPPEIQKAYAKILTEGKRINGMAHEEQKTSRQDLGTILDLYSYELLLYQSIIQTD